MSDLVVSYKNLSVPPADCAKDPPTPTKQDPNPKDGCSMEVPLQEEGEKNPAPRSIRFDRQGKDFVLSSANSSENLTWVGEHGNVKKITNILRVVEAVMRLSKQVPTPGGLEVMLRIAQYIVSGKAYFGGEMKYFPEITAEGNENQMASYLLEIVTHNAEETLQRLFGALTGFRGDQGFSNGASERIRWATDVLALKPAYIKFRDHFSDKFLIGEKFAELKDEKKKEKMSWILSFCRQTIIRNWKGLPLRYDEAFRQAFLAYQDLPVQNKGAETGDFCSRLDTALGELGQKVPTDFPGECRRAGKYLQVGNETAIRQSLRDLILSPDGLKELQKLIQEESDQANMKVEWLHDRGRIAAMLEVFLKNLEVTSPSDEKDPPKITLNASGLRLGLDLAIGKETLNQREYILAALALVRRFFLPLGASRPVRVFYRDGFLEVKMALKNGDESDMKNLQKSLVGQLTTSSKRTEKLLPILEATTCLGGIGGVWASEGVDSIAGDSRLQMGIGATSAGLAGAGCSAFVGHYLLPKTGKVHNRYLWEGLTGVGGAVVGVGLYFLIKSVAGSSGNDTRFPVDEYGP